MAAASVVAVGTVFVEASIASASISKGSRWSLANGNGRAFGVASVVASLTRGGAEEEEEVAPVAEVLYLPGLLEASIIKTAKVSQLFS